MDGGSGIGPIADPPVALPIKASSGHFPKTQGVKLPESLSLLFLILGIITGVWDGSAG